MKTMMIHPVRAAFTLVELLACQPTCPPKLQRRWKPWRRQTRSGFTLVELLVVIAIISILAALLMPTLKNSRNSARQIACMSNMKQVHLAIMLYADDNSGLIPPASGANARFNGVNWNAPYLLHQMLSKYISPSSPVWIDPGWPRDKPYFYSPPHLLVYGTPTVSSGSPDTPCTPANVGISYDYYWVGLVNNTGSGQVSDPSYPGNWKPCALYDLNVNKVSSSSECKLFNCLPWVGSGPQEPGPHGNNGRIWNVLWLDGHVNTVQDPYSPSGATQPNHLLFGGKWAP